MNSSVPFHLHDIGEAEVEAVSRVLRSAWVNTGPETAAFEKDLAAFLFGTAPDRPVVCVNSATAGLFLALKACGIGPGDEVVVPVYTYSATAAAVVHAGATPVPCDVDALCLLDAGKMDPCLSPRTRAVLPVDVGGLPCDLGALSACLESNRGRIKFQAREASLAARLGRPVIITDAAHSFGARIGSAALAACSAGDFSVFSFHAVKNLSTGDGGAVCVNLPAPELRHEAEKSIRLWSLHGQSRTALEKMAPGAWKYDIVHPGYKFNMTDIEAALGRVQLTRFHEIESRKRQIARRYDEAFAKTPKIQVRPRRVEAPDAPGTAEATRPNPKASMRIGSRDAAHHLYMLRVDGFQGPQRDRAIAQAAERGVSLNVHYQILPALTAWRERGWKVDDFPEAQALSVNEISLPLFSRMSEAQVEMVIEVTKRVVG